ncbi:peptide ABC transporter substrate-binding protein [Kurthia sibirica]|uniref:Oligopeptide ABC transporter substrate-binding protein n=1 Tax=Kurthia sibirica TaxID=202750 RepID=A0A2U3AHD6_9BACL|nr:peptide ABC transporter substrate-binding protein [Kurthia sibirica]PWI23904.1 oligopeptide ABC transporter substrate-binding protein [Kurthia sibirica]GEK34910.1 dipeptide-binding protein DppE [Kurthia sibirica]
MKKWLVMLLTVALFMVMAACTANKDAGKDSGGDKGKAVEKVLYLNNGVEPNSFDPSVAFDAVSWNPLNNLMEGLVRLNDKNEPTEAIAEKIDISEDGKEYTFTLRDANWSNGDKVTANDFVYGWKHMLEAKTASPAAFLAYEIVGAEDFNMGKGKFEAVGIKAPNDQTLKVTLKAPTEAFLNIITNPSFFPVNEKNAKTNPKWFAEADTFVGNGPFKLTAWEHDAKMTFEKNDQYWDKDVVKLSKVEWAMVNDTNTEYQMYKSGELDVSSVPSEMAEQLKDDKELSNMDQAGVMFFRFNTDKEPFTNEKVRQAFAMSIDQQQIVDYVTKTGQKAAHGFVSYGFVGPDGKEFREEVGDLITPDTAKAKALLAAGMKEEGWTTLPKITLTYGTSPDNQKIAVAVQDQLKKAIDVDVKLQNVEPMVFMAESKENKYQFFRSSFLNDYADPVNALESFITDSSMNRTNWSNKEFDKLIAGSKNESDAAKRWTMLQDAEKILIEEAPIVPVHFYNQLSLQKPNIKSIVRHPVGYMDLKWADKE